MRTEGAFVAVFNSYNQDVSKAKKILNIRYGSRAYDTHVKQYVDAGIMSIFESEPNKQRVYFVVILAELACARHGWVLKTEEFPFLHKEQSNDKDQ